MLPSLAAIQMTSSMELQDNLIQAQMLLEQAARSGAQLAVLPEMFPILGLGPAFIQAKLTHQEIHGSGPIQDFLAHQAKKLGLWIVGGSIALASHDPNKSFAACLVYNDQGKEVARYDKNHLFDVVAGDGINYNESDSTLPGHQPIVVDTPLGKLGLAICFDIRFPALFQEMSLQGAEIFAIPAAFTVPTGKAHWEILIRATAIQHFSYVVGAAQWGKHGMHRKTFGHSMIVNPNGEIMATLKKGTGIISAPIDLSLLRDIRSRFKRRMSLD